MPVEGVGEDAAEEHAEAAAAGHHEAEDAHRLRPFGLLGEEVHHQRQRDGRDDRAAEPLECPRRDQKPCRRGHTARDRGNGEERDADQEHPAMAVEVTEPAAEQEEAAEREEIRIHDPRERRLREAEVFSDRRQRDVHDRRVEDDHQVAEAEDVQREPAGAVIHGHVALLSVHGFKVGSRRLDGGSERNSSVTRPMIFPASTGPFSDGCLSAAEGRLCDPRPDRALGPAGALRARAALSSKQVGAEIAFCEVNGVAPDAVTADALARLQLAAGRRGCQVRLRGASSELLELLAFMGLSDVLPD